MIAVEYDELACAVTLTGRPAALRALAQRLQALADRAELGERQHDHLYSAEWAGFDLATVPPDPASRATVVHHVRLHGLPG
jgi:mRNA-degrading endonuclease YafQ of YafQ-DinJ toxin-antitoxin module